MADKDLDALVVDARHDPVAAARVCQAISDIALVSGDALAVVQSNDRAVSDHGVGLVVSLLPQMVVAGDHSRMSGNDPDGMLSLLRDSDVLHERLVLVVDVKRDKETHTIIS